MAASAAALAPPSAQTPKAETNRLNAQHSTGPRTPEGKAISSHNAFKHGLFASLQHLPPAERAVFDLIAQSIPHAYVCDDSALHYAARQVALLTYRLDRVRRLEFSTYVERMRALCEAESIEEPTDLAERGVLEARIFREDSLGPRTISKLHTQERFFTRQLEKATDVYHSALRDHDYHRRVPDGLRVPGHLQALLDKAAPKSPATPIQPPDAETTGDLASFSENTLTPEEQARVTVTIARSNPCPCGSGQKYKRCCGKNAPPQLH